MLKKLIVSAFAAALFVIPFSQAQSPQVPISVIVREDCQHCIKEKAFLEELQQTRTDIQVILHDIDTEEGLEIFEQLTERENMAKATPITLVGNTIIQGFGTAETTGKQIINLIEASKGKDTLTLNNYLEQKEQNITIETVENATCDDETCAADIASGFFVNVPFYGALNLEGFALPTMASLLGFIDGFNPCAMWVLVTFLIVLLQIGDRKLMWRVAGLFIAAEAIMYYLILNVWFTAWDFVGLDRIVTPIIGTIAIAAGLYFLYDGLTSDGTCKVGDLKQKKRIHTKIKSIAESPFTIATAIAIIGLALSVNIIEFACSVGIPQAFTKIIEINNLGMWETQGLMALYIFFYMVDDFIVFGIALWGAQHLHLTSKYAKYCHILGGIIMVILGYLLIFNPGALRF